MKQQSSQNREKTAKLAKFLCVAKDYIQAGVVKEEGLMIYIETSRL